MAGGAPILRSNSETRGGGGNATAGCGGNISSPSYSRNLLSFARSSHSEALMQGLNALRCAEKLFDVTLIVEGRTFKVTSH